MTEMNFTVRCEYGCLAPAHAECALVFCAVGQIQIDKRLIWDAGTVGLPLKVVNRVTVNIDRDLPFQLFCVRILSWVQICNIIFFSHSTTSPSIGVELSFCFGCFSCRNNADRSLGVTATMAYNADFFRSRCADNQKTFLIFRMIRVVEQNRRIVKEYRLCFFKGNLVFLLIDTVLIFIPFKSYRIHNYIIITSSLCVKWAFSIRAHLQTHRRCLSV